MKSLLIVTSIAFGVSLFSVFVPTFGLPVSITVSDVVIGLLLIYSLIRVGRLTPDPVSYATFLLAIVIFLSGTVNSLRDPTFDTANFLLNYINIIGLVAIVFLLPPLMLKLGHDRLAKSTMWVLRLQAVLLLVDAFSLLPTGWSPSDPRLARPTGLFTEPAWFGVFVGLSLFYVMQAQRNLKRQYIRSLDIALLSVAVIASAGVSGVILLGVFLLGMVSLAGERTRLKAVGGLSIVVLLFVSALALFPGQGPVQGLEKLASRAPSVLPPQLTDDSARVRIFGSLRGAADSVAEAPLLGTGLGGANQERIFVRDRERFSSDPPLLSFVSMPATLLQSAGVLGFLLFAFIVARMIMVTKSRWIGIGFIPMGIVWGGAYESVIWWYIALAVSFIAASRTAGELSHQRKPNVSALATVTDETGS